ncbi:MAG: NAD(P)-dependent oxidoreductase, partial [Rickettsiales bacterium]|nr:NAD(P)-dependent oxidoreductase [Rickettsiales bacterium]
TSWHGFACAMLAREQVLHPALPCRELLTVSTAEYAAKARRPLNSRMECGKARDVLGVALPDWEEGLRACYALIA